jgi:hypothetical protein
MLLILIINLKVFEVTVSAGFHCNYMLNVITDDCSSDVVHYSSEGFD